MLRHLLETKNRLALCVLFFCTSVLVVFTYREFLLFLLIKTTQLREPTGKSLNCYFIFTDVTELFSTYVTLTTTVAGQATFFYAALQLLNFLSFALFKAESYLARQFYKISFQFWGILLLVSFYGGIFAVWEFFLSFQNFELLNKKKIYFETKLKGYTVFCLSFTLYVFFYAQVAAAGVCFFVRRSSDRYFAKQHKKTILFLFLVTAILASSDWYLQAVILYFSFLLQEFACFTGHVSRTRTLLKEASYNSKAPPQ